MSIKIWTKRRIRRIRNRGYRNIFNLVIILLVICSISFILYSTCTPIIKLNGSSKVYLDYGNKYRELGYSTKWLGHNITSKTHVSGRVNEKVVGKYKIKYSVKYFIFNKDKYRIVNVVDRVSPIIDIDSSSIYVCPGSEVTPSKVKVSDNYDGDISDKLKYDTGSNYIEYYVRDSSGNMSSVKKEVIYKDKTPPTIKLIGDEFIYLFVGDSYNELGVESKDNCSDVSVKREGHVDSNKAGFYTITYKAEDEYHNVSEVKRYVIVSNRDNNGVIYLTFDDGPREGTTNVILDILKKEGVPATFFVTNRGPDYLIKREYDEGHSIGLHSSTHDYSKVYASPTAFFNDLAGVDARVKRVTGESSRIIRFPGGSSNTVSRRYYPGIMSILTREVLEKGYKYYDWNISSGDAEAGPHSADEIKRRVINSLRKDRANMVLMHDIKPYTRDALEDIIRYGKMNGYRFSKIDYNTDMIRQKINN